MATIEFFQSTYRSAASVGIWDDIRSYDTLYIFSYGGTSWTMTGEFMYYGDHWTEWDGVTQSVLVKNTDLGEIARAHGLEVYGMISVRETLLDAISGGLHGDDIILGSKFKDALPGFFGSDKIRGGRGNDDLFGDYGTDRLFGGRGDDTLIGGHGNDRLVGGYGDDTLMGGTGRDLFVFVGGVDVIKDFNVTYDRIKFSKSLISDLEIIKVKGDTHLVFNEFESKIIIEDVYPRYIDVGDMILG